MEKLIKMGRPALLAFAAIASLLLFVITNQDVSNKISSGETFTASDLLIQQTKAQTDAAAIEAMLPSIDVAGAMTSASVAVMTKYGSQFAIIFALVLVPVFLGLILWVIFFISGKIRQKSGFAK